MKPITNLDELIENLKGSAPKRVVVAAGHDENTIEACHKAAVEKIALVTLVGDKDKIDKLCVEKKLDRDAFDIVDEEDEAKAGTIARNMVRNKEGDCLMKGLIGTDKYMKLILDKEEGLLTKGNILSHITVIDSPYYQKTHKKLLFVGDVAVIPLPDLQAKIKILEYLIDAAHKFGIEKPKAAILTANEKVSDKMPTTIEAAIIAKMADRGQIKGAIVDGPLALDVAISKEACDIKGLKTPVDGDADILVFPSIEAGNIFYKGVTHLGGSRLAAVVAGTTAPCILTSRADDEESKFFSIALGLRLCNKN
ncbi:MAG: phosphate acyltransferase [Acidobacteria bacterium]|nr:phosphate acyltransferase [Acidobacteriota bacterium]